MERRFRVSLHPPPTNDDAAPWPSWVLLDMHAYIADRQNSTTAFSKTRDGRHAIQVTFCFAHPPRVSYFCVYSPDLPPPKFSSVPKVVATEGGLALIRIVLAGQAEIGNPRVNDYYYIYQVGKGKPKLDLLPQPHPYSFHDDQVGFLLHDTTTHRTDDRCKLTLRPHRHDGGHNLLYTIAALCESSVPGQFDLYLLHSKDGAWTTKTLSLDQQQQHGSDDFCHDTSKVIAIGGEGGTVAFVDLRWGIVQCDVLREDPVIRYIPLPEPLKPGRKLSDPWTARDIAVVQGRIKYVELQMHIRPGSYKHGFFISDGWTAATWSRMATSSLEEEDWQLDCKLNAYEVSLDNNPAQLELLPKLQDDQGTPRPTLERIHIGQPTISLHNDDVVYFMTKVDHRDRSKAWVIAVDMRNRTLQGVAEFGAQRTLGICYTYTHSRISKYLNTAPGAGTKGHLKRPGMPLMGSPPKKMPEKIPFTDFLTMTMQHWNGEQKHQDAEVEGASVGAEDGDSNHSMDLE